MATKKRKKRRQPRVRPNTSHLPVPPASDHLTLSEYEITDEPLVDHRIKKLPPQVQERIAEICHARFKE